jgi:hypothetical protein
MVNEKKSFRYTIEKVAETIIALSSQWIALVIMIVFNQLSSREQV